MLPHESRTSGPKDESQNHGDQDRVVKLTGHRDEVGDQIEGHREVSHEQGEQQLAPARDPRIAEQSTKQHDAVGDEAAQRASVAAAAGDEQRTNEESVHGNRDPEPDQCPFDTAHETSIASPVSSNTSARGRPGSGRRRSWAHAGLSETLEPELAD